MSQTEEFLTPAQIKEWSLKPLVITELGANSEYVRTGVEPLTPYGNMFDGINIHGSHNDASMQYSSGASYTVVINAYHNDEERRIGYIAGVNSDGSFNMYILGHGSFPLLPEKRCYSTIGYTINGDTHFGPLPNQYMMPDELVDFGAYNWGDSQNRTRSAWLYPGAQTTSIPFMDSFAYEPAWYTGSGISGYSSSFVHCAQKGNDYVITTGGVELPDTSLTDSPATTIHLGVPLDTVYFQNSQSGYYFGDKNIGGDVYDLMNSITTTSAKACANLDVSLCYNEITTTGPAGTLRHYLQSIYQPFAGSMAYHYTPYNLILTYKLNEALDYLETGELPSDAFIYPFDVDNIPVNVTGGTSASDSDGTSKDGEGDGDSTGDFDGDDQSTITPINAPQSFSNNNLYWLSAGQLQQFMDWFWTDATDVTSPSELIEKIKGLYENLSEAIIAVRYMPAFRDYLGIASYDTKIIVGMLEMEMQVLTLSNITPPVVNIGEIDITELSYKGFINYSPYCEMRLYLPFYGYLDLDADILMEKNAGRKLAVQCVYDVLGGTIQYYIFVGGYNGQMINTVCAKMATDIPITLQTKNQRDSAIFGNVANATANLIGAGASAVSGNPIGLVMSTANIAGSQPSGAPMSVKGTISETGAYYDHAHCALFIKRPALNRPSKEYGRRIGYPANTERKLSRCKGFIQCANPYLSFSAVTEVDEDGFQPPKPTAEEIETIYQALQDGVYIL